MDKKQDSDLSKAQPLYGVWDRAMASNDAEQMKAGADELRRRAKDNPDLQPKIDELDAAISKLSD